MTSDWVIADPLAVERWRAARRILAVRLDALGDVLMTTPALRALKESAPSRSLTLLTSASGAAAARLIPEVDESLAHEAAWMKATGRRRDGSEERRLIERLRRERFDAAVIFTVYSQSPLPAALACHLANIPLRLAHCRENPYQLLTEWVRETEPERGVRHEVRRQLDLVAAVGARTDDERLSLRVPPDAVARAEAALDALGLDRARPWMVVHPGASAPSRRYPEEGFATAARRLTLEAGLQLVFTGSADEDGLVERVRELAAVPTWSLAGRLALPELAAVLSLAPQLLSNNTGPVHVAAAVGTPVTVLYALTNPQHAPWGVPHRVLSNDVPCRWCYRSVCPEGHHLCLRGVTADDVVDAVTALLDETAARPRPAVVA